MTFFEITEASRLGICNFDILLNYFPYCLFSCTLTNMRSYQTLMVTHLKGKTGILLYLYICLTHFHSLSKNRFYLFFFYLLFYWPYFAVGALDMLKKATVCLGWDPSISPQCGVLSFDLTFASYYYKFFFSYICQSLGRVCVYWLQNFILYLEKTFPFPWLLFKTHPFFSFKNLFNFLYLNLSTVWNAFWGKVFSMDQTFPQFQHYTLKNESFLFDWKCYNVSSYMWVLSYPVRL